MIQREQLWELISRKYGKKEEFNYRDLAEHAKYDPAFFDRRGPTQQPERTINRLLQELERQGYVDRPHAPRKDGIWRRIK